MNEEVIYMGLNLITMLRVLCVVLVGFIDFHCISSNLFEGDSYHSIWGISNSCQSGIVPAAHTSTSDCLLPNRESPY